MIEERNLIGEYCWGIGLEPGHKRVLDALRLQPLHRFVIENIVLMTRPQGGQEIEPRFGEACERWKNARRQSGCRPHPLIPRNVAIRSRSGRLYLRPDRPFNTPPPLPPKAERLNRPLGSVRLPLAG